MKQITTLIFLSIITIGFLQAQSTANDEIKRKAESHFKLSDHLMEASIATPKSNCLNPTDHIMNFEPDEEFSGWGFYDANQDDNYWKVFEGAGINGTSCVGYGFSATNAADDYLFSPCFNLVAGRSYEVSFYYATEDQGSLQEKMKVIYSTSTDSENNTLIVDLGIFAHKDFRKSTSIVEITHSDAYYFGWHCYSNANMWNLYVDSVRIRDVSSTIEDIEGNTYFTATIGNQEWMAQNLRVTKFNNEDPIPYVVEAASWSTLTSAAYSIYPYESILNIDSEEEVLQTHGVVYNGYILNDSLELCPAGWKIPSQEDWYELIEYVGEDAALKLKATNGWSLTGNGTDEYGFSATSGGFRQGSSGNFSSARIESYWLTSTVVDDNYFRGMKMNRDENSVTSMNYEHKSNGYYIRCIKGDEPHDEHGVIQGTVSDATTSDPIEGATVSAGGETTTTASDGSFTLQVQEATSINISADGYSSYSNTNINVQVGDEITLNFVLSPVITGNQYRLVLTWDAEPSDLDSYLITPIIEGSSYTINYTSRGSSTSAPYANLDVDKTDGYGPETITIEELHNGYYAYYVHQYTGNDSISKPDEVNVKVYDNSGLIASFVPPAQGSGKYWHVCNIKGETGEIIEINQIIDQAPSIATSTWAHPIDNGMSVYPNPFSGAISVSSKVGLQRVQLVNILGQRVIDMNPNGASSLSVITSELKSGAYILIITDVNGTRATERMMKK